MTIPEGERATEVIEQIDIETIQRMIPHRYPFLMIDRVRQLRAHQGAIGVKNVSINEPFFAGHFPPQPILPGVLIIEAMAQTAAVLVVHTLDMIDKGKLVYFMTVDNTKFRKKVVPGDVLELHVSVQRAKKNIWAFAGEGKVDGQVVAESEFKAMIVDPPETAES